MKQPNEKIQEFTNELQKRTTANLYTDRYSKILYSTDASIYQVMPYGVFIPKTVADIQAAVELAAQYKLPILPRGGGSSLAGQAVNEALVIDTSVYLRQPPELNREEKSVWVQPGVTLDELNHLLKPSGLKFGPDPASSNRATIGGMVANNSTGSHSIIYGMTADHLLEIDVILSDGSRTTFAPLPLDSYEMGVQVGDKIYNRIFEIIRNNSDVIQAGTPHHWRRCGGYNLDRLISHKTTSQFNLSNLICGSEGTLAIIGGVKLNLVPIPAYTAISIVHFDSIYEALTAVPSILQVDPSAVELIDNMGLTMCRNAPKYAKMLRAFVDGKPDCILIVEFYGDSEVELKHKMTGLKEILKDEKVGYTTLVPLFEPELQNKVWAVRKASVGFLMSVKSDYKPIPFIEDTAVPVEHLPEYISRVESFCNELGTKIIYYGHASAGCLHIRPLINTKIAKEVDKLPIISSFVMELVSEYGGAFSSEHGDGRARSWLNGRFFGKELYDLYRQVKYSFDPDNILNPGNIVDAPPMTEHLRYGADYSTIAINEQLDFGAEGGFSQAVEMCNGVAVCRKSLSGVMCPTFMATGKEEYSTRGRANMLRAALSGQLPSEELTSKRMYEIITMCLGCKACKSECPSSVDMAKLKIEFLAQYHKKNGLPLRARLFANYALWGRLSSGLFSRPVNFVLRHKLFRRFLARFVGIAFHARLPEFSDKPFHRWFKQNRAKVENPKGQVVLFNDTSYSYNYPNVAICAVKILEATGFELLLPGHKCCGRPMLSNGLVDKARQAARETLDRLAPFAEQGLPIVGLEPACLLTIRDDYFSLLPDDRRVKLVAEHCYTFEEFIVKLADEERLELDFVEADYHILLHMHCFQQSLAAVKISRQLLSLLPNCTITEVGSSCCGMAGSFGYEAEHYEISGNISSCNGFDKAVYNKGNRIVVTSGFSCRHKMETRMGTQALHPAELLWLVYNSCH